MNKTMSIITKVTILAIIAGMGILYILNRSPVEDLGTYEKQEMASPNRSRSIIDQFFSSQPDRGGNYTNDDVSLMGASGRYDEVRIGKKAEEESE